MSQLKGIKPKPLSDLYDLCAELGCALTRTGGNHVKIKLPDGGVTFGPATASDGRALLNMRAQLRRMGLKL